MKYDIGLVGVLNDNYGNNMTNYALWQFLTDSGFKTAILNTPWDTISNRECENCFSHFYKVPYYEECINVDFKDKSDLIKMNSSCDMFVVGSDQIWRIGFARGTKWYSYLEWVEDSKYKMSYATSFAVENFEGDEIESQKAAYLLNRFQKISVRESSGVRLLKNTWGIKGVHVIDPVFICDVSHYHKMAELSRVNTKCNYIGMYLWEHKAEYEDIAISFGKKCGHNNVKLIEVVDKFFYKPTDTTKIKPLNKDKYNVKVEDWLKVIRDSEIMLTDSFHGLCFAIIFNKQFYYLMNGNTRGNARVESLLSSIGLMNRIIYTDSFDINSLDDSRIEYEEVLPKLQKIIDESKMWLMESISDRKKYATPFNNSELYIEKVRLEMELEKTKEKMYSLATSEILRNNNLSRDTQFVAWGAGYWFKTNIDLIKNVFKIKYVCDSDEDKWGLKDKGVECISPKELQRIDNVFVIIFVKNRDVVDSIKTSLTEMGIVNYLSISEWFYMVEN